MDRDKLIKSLVTITAVMVFVAIASFIRRQSEYTLADYAADHPEVAYATTEASGDEDQTSGDPGDASGGNDQTSEDPGDPSGGNDQTSEDPGDALTSASETDADSSKEETPGATSSDEGMGSASESGDNILDYYESPEDAFYYEPLSEELIASITGVSYPADPSEAQISTDELRYLHILHYDFDGQITEGELICNDYIAEDLREIFYELYQAQYQIEKVRLIDAYGGDDHLSMADNNTSCFNYRVVDDTTTLSKHALGLAIDVNPFYNPYVRKDSNGGWYVSPEGAESYRDRSADFPHKIDENDLCYQLFKEHGFFWGGDWKNTKDYQHFQKVPE
jgi:hypothetical protein